MNFKALLAAAAVSVVAATSASALTLLDSDDAGTGPFDLLADSYQFQDIFADGDAGETLMFEFANTSAQGAIITISSATINQDAGNFFTGGASVSWAGAGLVAQADQGMDGSGQLDFFLGAGLSDTLTLTFGEVVGPQLNPDVDFTVRAELAPVPVPAGILLMGTALAGLGVMRRRRKAA